MIEFLIACSPVIAVPGMPMRLHELKANCGPGNTELVESVEERKESRVRVPTRHLNIVDWKINL